MEEYHQITLDEWSSWVEDIRTKLSETAQNFVYIGYRLKQIRDSGNFGGAEDVFEFAQKEYGISKSAVSRFIAINEKYSEGGNSLELKEQYKGFSSSKLSEMLSLPDSECELITEETTVKQIRELKNFDRQQPDNIVSMDGDEEDENKPSPLDLCIIDYFKDKKDMLNNVMALEYDSKHKEAAEAMNPSGSASHSKGICFMFMYDYNTGIKYRLLTEPQPLAMTWDKFLETIYWIYCNIYESGQEDVWSEYYKAVATSQQETSDIPKNEPTEIQTESEAKENENPETLINPEAEEQSEKEKNLENIENTEKEESENPESCIEPVYEEAQPVATSQQNDAALPEDNKPEPPADLLPQEESKGAKVDSHEHSDDRFTRRGQMLERIEKLQKAINLQEWDYALDIHKRLGWDIEWFANN